MDVDKTGLGLRRLAMRHINAVIKEIYPRILDKRKVSTQISTRHSNLGAKGQGKLLTRNAKREMCTTSKGLKKRSIT